MINDLMGKIILMITTLFIHCGILAVYWWEEKWRIYPQSWSYPFTAIVIMMMIFSLALPFTRNFRFRLGILLFRIIMAAVLAVPFSADIVSYGFIFAVLIFESFLFLPKILAILSTTLCVVYNIWLSNQALSLWFEPAEQVDFAGFMLIYALYAICGASGYYLSREQQLRAVEMQMLKEFKESNEYLAMVNINLQNVAAEEEKKTLTKERSRIAREIHDSVAYTLTNLLSHLDAYRERLQADAREVPDNIIQARNLVREGLGDIRQVLKGLRPGENEGYAGLGKISHLIKVFIKATGIHVNLNYSDVHLYPGRTIEDMFYRVVQEGLTNAFRHGLATEVFISFHYEKGGIELTVRDNGQGSEIKGEGFGLIGIDERVKAMNGRVTIISKPGFGFTLRVWIPMQEEEITDGTPTYSHR